jgi:hypothetical protein
MVHTPRAHPRRKTRRFAGGFESRMGLSHLVLEVLQVARERRFWLSRAKYRQLRLCVDDVPRTTRRGRSVRDSAFGLDLTSGRQPKAGGVEEVVVRGVGVVMSILGACTVIRHGGRCVGRHADGVGAVHVRREGELDAAGVTRVRYPSQLKARSKGPVLDLVADGREDDAEQTTVVRPRLIRCRRRQRGREQCGRLSSIRIDSADPEVSGDHQDAGGVELAA